MANGLRKLLAHNYTLQRFDLNMIDIRDGTLRQRSMPRKATQESQKEMMVPWRCRRREVTELGCNTWHWWCSLLMFLCVQQRRCSFEFDFLYYFSLDLVVFRRKMHHLVSHRQNASNVYGWRSEEMPKIDGGKQKMHSDKKCRSSARIYRCGARWMRYYAHKKRRRID